MMPKHRTLRAWPALVALAFLPQNTASVTGALQKPTRLIIANVEFKAPPPSLDEMKWEAEAVVHGRVLDATPRDGDFYHNTLPGITTYHRFQVESVLWRGPRPVRSDELLLIRDGGTMDRGDRFEKVEIDVFPQFEVGHEYVLFLRWHAVHRGYTPAWGPGGSFEIVSGKMKAMGRATISKQQEGLTVEEFARKLR